MRYYKEIRAFVSGKCVFFGIDVHREFRILNLFRVLILEFEIGPQNQLGRT